MHTGAFLVCRRAPSHFDEEKTTSANVTSQGPKCQLYKKKRYMQLHNITDFILKYKDRIKRNKLQKWGQSSRFQKKSCNCVKWFLGCTTAAFKLCWWLYQGLSLCLFRYECKRACACVCVMRPRWSCHCLWVLWVPLVHPPLLVTSIGRCHYQPAPDRALAVSPQWSSDLAISKGHFATEEDETLLDVLGLASKINKILSQNVFFLPAWRTDGGEWRTRKSLPRD